MKKILFLIFFLSSASEANEKCAYLATNLKFIAPDSQDIAKTFWQDSKDGYETVKRLYITYKDGSTAVIEHKFCSMYNFEVAYYVQDKSKLAAIETIQKKANALLSYSALKDSSQQEALTAIAKNLNERNFNPDKDISTGYSGYNENYGDTEYAVSYLPIENSSLHQAALFVYVGMGGMH